MIYSKTQSNKNKKTSGFSIVMVIVAMAFVGVLVAVIMLASLYSFYSKATNRNAKDNFYTAETALEEIRAGLQIEVDKAFNTAYMSVFQDYSTNLSEKNARFGKAYRTTLVNNLQDTSVDADSGKQYNLAKIQGYVTRPYNATTSVGAKVDGVMVDVVKEDGTTETRPRTALIEYTDGVRLEGIQVEYSDERGYVSIISTNILLKVPDLDLINPVIVPPLEDYALIANNQLQINRNTTLAGGAYGGSRGISVVPSMNFTIKRADFQNTIDEKAHNVYVTTDKDIDVGTTAGFSSLTIEPGIEVWANGINTFGGKLTMNKSANYASSIYLQDDLTIRSKGNNINLSGKFYGFGSIVNDPGNSSAIVINGTNTTLDLSGLDTLKVAGNAYIATKRVNDNVNLSDLEDKEEEEEEEEEEPEETLIEKVTKILHTTQSGNTNYFIFAPGRWTGGNAKHNWSQDVETGNPRATYYEVKFTGHKIDIYAGKNTMMGIVDYFVDGEKKFTADLYNGGNIDSTYITTISGLVEGEHTLRVEATGTKNQAAGGNIRIDAAEVYVYSYINPGEQEDSTRIPHTQQSGATNYFIFPSGRWTGGNAKHNWSQDVETGNPRATYYEVKFTGHKIDIYAGKNTMMGMVDYFVDGEKKFTADLYNNGNIDSAYITTISGLEEGPHTFRAEATGTRNSSGGGNIRIDAAEVYVYTYIKTEKPVTPKEPKPPKVPTDEKMAELKNNKDIRTGSSISSKAEQMAYLVPPQYVGWIDGKCVIGTNPVSEDVYRRFRSKIGSFAGGLNYNEVNLSADLSLSNYGAGFEKVFVRTTSGNTWVYYYLKFANAAWADRFFEDYFRDNKAKLNSYMDSYISSIKLNPTLEASDSLSFYLAGNMITGSASNYKLVPYTSTNLEENSKVYEEFTEYENQFGALNKILRKNYKEMTEIQRGNTVYANVVDTTAMGKLNKNRLVFYENEGSTKPIALIKKGDYTWTGTGDDSDLHMIICDGNVSVQANFSGLIIAGGTITIDAEVTVSAYDLLNTAMMAETRESTPFLIDEMGATVIQHMPLYFLVEGQEKEIREEKDISDVTYTASDFVIYENWSKQ